MKKRRVAIGIVGSELDAGSGAKRWKRWRPTVSLCSYPALPIDKLELLYQPGSLNLAEVITGDIETLSPGTQVRKKEILFDDPWDFVEVFSVLHDFAQKYTFDVEREEYLVHITTGTHVAQICLFLLTESRYIPAKLIQTVPPEQDRRSGSTYRIIDLDVSNYEQIALRFRKEQHQSVSFLKNGIETRNKTFNNLIDQIEKVATSSKEPILLIGPTGAGKSQLAKLIYELKKKRQKLEGKFKEVNCATIRGDGAMSTLFGHIKGSFTGADKNRPGLLLAADKGVLFLDEIGELGVDEQAMLLRALEEKSFFPLGSDDEVRSSFQLIAGTNRNLAALVKQGHFRGDLLARIKLWMFNLPGLRDRPEDIEPNLDYELGQVAKRIGSHIVFQEKARKRFLDFATSPQALWADNFRDFAGAITRMATLASEGRVSIVEVEEEIARLKAEWLPKTDGEEKMLIERLLGKERVDQLDLFAKIQLEGVLKVCCEARSLSEAGRMLFSASRNRRKVANDADRLRKYLAKFGIEWRQVQNELNCAPVVHQRSRTG